MFDKLMFMLKRGGTVTIDQMARELDTTPEVVAEMLDRMTHTGWLRDVALSCDQSCAACVFARDCVKLNRSRVWQVHG